MTGISTPVRRVFSASTVRDTIAATLRNIKEEDGITYADLGRVMGKSGDRAEAYCNGDFSDMSGFSMLPARIFSLMVTLRSASDITHLLLQ